MKALIIYATNDGHNFELGQFIQQLVLPTAPLVNVADYAQIPLANLDLLVLCPCTYGEGQLTAKEEQFYHYLQEQPVFPAAYYLAGVGDRNFGRERFANAVTIFNQLLHQHSRAIDCPLKIDYDEINSAHQQIITSINRYLQRRK